MGRVVFLRRRMALLLAVAAAIGVGAWCLWLRPPPDPVQRLSEWMANQKGVNSLSAHTAETLRAFGPGTVEWLAYTAEFGREGFYRNGSLPFDRAPAWLRRRLPEEWGGLKPYSRIGNRVDALFALRALGPEAAPAIPSLSRILERECEKEGYAVTEAAAEALHAIGPASWPAVEQLFERGKPQARTLLLDTIEIRLGTEEEPASEAEMAKVVAILVKACGDPNASVRAEAAFRITACRSSRPDLIAFDSAIPKLLELVSDSDMQVRLDAAQGLSKCGVKAAPAIRQLIEMLDERAAVLRKEAAAILSVLDMDEKLSAARLRIMARDDPDAECRGTAAWALKKLGILPDHENCHLEAFPAGVGR